MVADTRMRFRGRTISMMPAMLRSKPMSSSRSASSITTVSRLWCANAAVLFRWSSRRPGVATSTVIPLRRRAFSLWRSSPPWMAPTTMKLAFRTHFVRTVEHCSASSRVGAMTMQIVPAVSRLIGWTSQRFRSWCSIGRPYASVFPLPVSLRTRTSFSETMGRHASFCTRVSWVMPIASTACARRGCSSSCSGGRSSSSTSSAAAAAAAAVSGAAAPSEEEEEATEACSSPSAASSLS
mmetsp:Transcript_9818/g.30309  ORF Transcript_9818/g.30309 Transcript_9818/m.30309 type:complete len:238 (-) Transcript_9818:904-1617(-)